MNNIAIKTKKHSFAAWQNIRFLMMLAVFIALTLFLFLTLNTATAFDAPKQSIETQKFLTRGEATAMIVEAFELKNKNSDFLANCHLDAELCLFDFLARSRFAGLKLEPLRLYPDVFPSYKYYHQINTATKLGLVRGYFDVANSPYRPRQLISKAEALKIALGAAEKMQWKEQFEVQNHLAGWQATLSDSLAVKGGEEALLSPEAWWKLRYVVFALEAGLLENNADFDPDSPLSATELDEWLGMLGANEKETLI